MVWDEHCSWFGIGIVPGLGLVLFLVGFDGIPGLGLGTIPVRDWALFLVLDEHYSWLGLSLFLVWDWHCSWLGLVLFLVWDWCCSWFGIVTIPGWDWCYPCFGIGTAPAPRPCPFPLQKEYKKALEMEIRGKGLSELALETPDFVRAKNATDIASQVCAPLPPWALPKAKSRLCWLNPAWVAVQRWPRPLNVSFARQIKYKQLAEMEKANYTSVVDTPEIIHAQQVKNLSSQVSWVKQLILLMWELQEILIKHPNNQLSQPSGSTREKIFPDLHSNNQINFTAVPSGTIISLALQS